MWLATFLVHTLLICLVLTFLKFCQISVTDCVCVLVKAQTLELIWDNVFILHEQNLQVSITSVIWTRRFGVQKATLFTETMFLSLVCKFIEEIREFEAIRNVELISYFAYILVENCTDYTFMLFLELIEDLS